MLTASQQRKKRLFDVVAATTGICLTGWLMLLAWVVASAETKSNGLFMQTRIGKDGRRFNVFKIKTMNAVQGVRTTVTTSRDRRITRSGAFFRRTKIDELPQLFNVLSGEMSFVGPRPDVPGFADELEGEDRMILQLRPGITGPASLKYKDEEKILSMQDDPEAYNREVIWPDKVAINKAYMQTWSLKKDIGYIIQTVLG
ncbi:sugar transferase [Sulfurovum sp.]|uniref:sugar transferase n=1 Tax=Sulfurovum sp. TaxID=1969726 RepID=UPI0025EE564E|nr:sugar transferase [Sulfurovum sp.]